MTREEVMGRGDSGSDKGAFVNYTPIPAFIQDPTRSEREPQQKKGGGRGGASYRKLGNQGRGRT